MRGTELVDRGDRIHELHPQVRRVVVEPEVHRRNDLEHPPPDRRGAGQIPPKRPALGEQHRAVLDAQPRVVVFRESHDVGPDLLKLPQVVVQRQVLVRADEGIDHRQFEQHRRFDHFAKVDDRRLGLIGFLRERVGIVAQRRNLDAMLFAQCSHVVGLSARKRGAVDVHHAAVLAIRAGRRPAHHLDAVVANVRGVLENFFEGELAEDCGDESQLHCLPPLNARSLIGG